MPDQINQDKINTCVRDTDSLSVPIVFYLDDIVYEFD
jgi:hypothetical protein